MSQAPVFSLGRKDARAAQRDPSRSTIAIPNEVQSLIGKKIYERIKMDSIDRLDRPALIAQIESAIGTIADEEKLQIGADHQRALAATLADDMKGIGPLQRLMDDDEISEIMVNGPHRIFTESKGRLRLSDVTFRDDDHVRSIATRIARQVGRRVDEANPICDARLPDGSRVCIIIPPVALDGTYISIRRFPNQNLGLEELATMGTMSAPMRDFLQIAAKSRLNIIVSGGTSSGKTTLLNALSQHINTHESIITIEDSAELSLKQPNVRRLETRPALNEGAKEITQRDLVKAALRMRPDRIVVGEVRGGEAFDMLQACNTGHDGSMSTLHANTARDAIARLENMILMAVELPMKAIRTQVASAIDIVIQVERMTDGVRRITDISEVVGMEGDVISMQQLFVFDVDTVKSGSITGKHRTMPVTLHCQDKLKRTGLLDAARIIFAKS